MLWVLFPYPTFVPLESKSDNKLVGLATDKTVRWFVVRTAHIVLRLRFAAALQLIVLRQLQLIVRSSLACTACSAWVRFLNLYREKKPVHLLSK
jgi:hypothetical protein